MIGAAGASMMGSSPSFSSGASATADSRSGNVDSYFASGDFVVGGDKNMIWVFVLIAAVAVAFFFFKGKK